MILGLYRRKGMLNCLVKNTITKTIIKSMNLHREDAILVKMLLKSHVTKVDTSGSTNTTIWLRQLQADVKQAFDEEEAEI